jgi:hypothetical protein
MMGYGAFILLKSALLRRESLKQAEIRFARSSTILAMRRGTDANWLGRMPA